MEELKCVIKDMLVSVDDHLNGRKVEKKGI